MAYQALYRTYRPQTFADLIGQAAVKRVLENALRQDKIAHAYLFTGPRGTGKTTVARLLAKALNCLQATADQPICDQCAACQAIRDGASLDVIEIDAASNRGIDDIRALRERVGYPPQELRRKVYIIDEVHMLSKEAFNALLKTLEEPPAHTIFILATTEADKVPVTIQSRCQRLIFSHATVADLAEQLQRVAEREGAKLTPGAVNVLVELAEGGFRDALSLLERVMALEGEVDEAAIAGLFGLGDERRIQGMIKALIENDRTKLFANLISAEKEGASPIFVAQAVIRALRRLLYVVVGAISAQDEAEAGQAARLTTDQLWPWLAAWLEARAEARRAPIPYLPLEIAAAKCLSGSGQPVALEPNKDSETAPTPTPVVVSAEGSLDLTASQWRQIVSHVTRHNQAIGKLLGQATPQGADDGRVKVAVAYPFHVEQLNQPTNRSLLASALAAAGLSDLNIEFVSHKNPVPPGETASVHDVIDML